MGHTPAVTIATRTFDRPHLLDRAIDSAISQTFSDWEMIVVNNGGRCEPVDAAIARREPEHQGRVRALHLERAVPIGAAGSAAIDAGSGEFLIVLDDDDTWTPNALEQMVLRLRELPAEYGAVTSRVRIVHERIRSDGEIEQISDEPFNPNLEYINFQTAYLSHPISTNSLLIRRTVYEQLGSYDSELTTGDDAFFVLKLLTTHRIDVIQEELGARHQREPDAQTGRNMISDEMTIRDNDARYRDYFVERRMRAGELTPEAVAQSISQMDRENHRLTNSALDDVSRLRFLAADALDEVTETRDFLDAHYQSFWFMTVLAKPVVALRSVFRRTGDGAAL